MNNSFIKILNLEKQYPGGVKALNKISLDIYEGEVLGLLGVNGAGKTTLSSILATLHPPTSGDVLWNGESIYKNINEYRKIIGFCSQKPSLIDDLTVEENLFYAGKFYGLDSDLIKDRMQKLIKQFSLEMYKDNRPDVLSGGYKQRVMIARALMNAPKIVILDEPTVGLDPHIRHQLWERIRELKGIGVSVILTTHYLDEAEILSDRICMLDKGEIKLIDTPDNLKLIYNQSRLEDVFLELIRTADEK
jgi:ABC-2 type transport system ATP-binding protein